MTCRYSIMDFRELLWDEYKYRHQHVWATVFKLTAAVVLVSIVPYTNREVACVLGWRAVAPPVVASCLAIFGLVRMWRELEILMTIRAAHRRLQELIKPSDERFSTHVKVFLSLLIIAAIANAYIVLSTWQPAVAPHDGKISSCFPRPSSPSQDSAP